MKNFSREYGHQFMSEERKQAADKIKTLRADRRDEREGTKERLENIDQKIEVKRKALDNLIKIVGGLEKQLDKKSNSFLEKLKDHFEKKKIREELGVQSSGKRITEQDIDWLERQKEIFSQQEAIDKYQKQIDEILKELHDKQDVDSAEYYDLKQELNLKNVAEKCKGVFLHGTLPMGSPNAALENGKNLSWQDKIDVMLTIPTAISASLYNKIQNPHYPKDQWITAKFGPVGVFLVGGEIRAAWPSDNGTNRVMRESFGNSKQDLKRVKRELSEIEPGMERRSEYVIRNPKIGGIWFEHRFKVSNNPELDEYKKKDLEKVGGAKELAKKAKELNVPVFALHQGDAHEVYFEGDNYIIKEKPVDFEHLREQPSVYMKDSKRADAVFGRIINGHALTSRDERHRYTKHLEAGLKAAGLSGEKNHKTRTA